MIGKLMVNDFQKILMETKQLLRDGAFYRSKPDSSEKATRRNGSCRSSCVEDEGQAGRKKALKEFTLDRMLQETERVYNGITNQVAWKLRRT